jgi:poly(3-hydroxybutyrate) depolymerase
MISCEFTVVFHLSLILFEVNQGEIAMKSVRSMVGVMVLVLATAPAWSSSKTTINIGRSDVSLTVPEDYSRHTAVPLIVILHGYTDNSGNHDRYMKFSSLVDEYEFLLLAPDGARPGARIILSGTRPMPAVIFKAAKLTTRSISRN